MRKYKNKYRVDTFRLPGFDYGSNGAYFVTIMTENKIPFFGSVPKQSKIDPENPKIQLSEIGKIADSIWLEIPDRFDYAELGAFVIMPDHMHGVVIIDKDGGGGFGTTDEIGNTDTNETTDTNPNIDGFDTTNKFTPKTESTSKSNAIKNPGGITGNHNPMLHQNLSRIIRWYKGRVTFEARKINPEFAWKRRFYDVIIWEGRSLEDISKYIRRNPIKWQNEKK